MALVMLNDIIIVNAMKMSDTQASASTWPRCCRRLPFLGSVIAGFLLRIGLRVFVDAVIAAASADVAAATFTLLGEADVALVLAGNLVVVLAGEQARLHAHHVVRANGKHVHAL